jgi:hypothetical protein
MADARGLLGAIGRAMAAVVPLVLALPAVAAAESVRAAVREHLAKELSATGNETNTTSDSSFSSGSDSATDDTDTDADEPASEPAGAPLEPGPVVSRQGLSPLGRQAFLDVSIESRMQVWLPAQHPSVHLDAAPYRTFRLELRGGVDGLFSLHQLALETDGSTWVGWRGPAVSPAAGTSGIGAAAALASIGLPFLRFGGAKWWEPIIRYEVTSYATTATPSRSVCLVPRDADTAADPPACAPTDGPLRMASSFESLIVGIQIASASGTFVNAGVDMVRQRKPYQVNVDGRTLDDLLFDARFGGAGAALGFGVGRDQGLSLHGSVHLGAAWVSLTNDLSLGDVLPAGWDLEYFRWSATLGYGHVLWKGPPLLQLRAGLDGSGLYFIYQRDDAEETPTLSRDLFFTGRLALVMML